MNADLFTLWRYDPDHATEPWRIIGSCESDIPYGVIDQALREEPPAYPLISVTSKDGVVVDWSIAGETAFNVRQTHEVAAAWDRLNRDHANQVKALLSIEHKLLRPTQGASQ